MRTIYAVVTRHCNLDCDYCEIASEKENYNEHKFIEALKSFDDDYVILFGGEPLLYLDRAQKALETGNISTITTNLMSHTALIGYIKDTLKDKAIKMPTISTSWSYNRFRVANNTKKSIDNYNLWKTRLDEYSKEVDVEVLVTMTNELLEVHHSDFLNIARDWNCYGIKFEYLLDKDINESYYDKVDEWLCNIYKNWDLDSVFINTQMIKETDGSIKYNCEDVYTLLPSGELLHGCPHMIFSKLPSMVPEKCYDCDQVKTCRPCKLQKYCSYPKKLAMLVLK